MVNKLLLQSAICSCGLNDKYVALHLGIGFREYKQKMNGVREFRLSEVKTLIKILGLTPNELVEIFFT